MPHHGPVTTSREGLRHFCYAVWKNPESLTANQQAKLAWIAEERPSPLPCWPLNEGLRHVFKVKGQTGKEALDRWLSWAAWCRIAPFVDLGKMIRRHREPVDNALDHNLSIALIESTNTKIRLIQRMALGCKSPDALITRVSMLALRGFRPPLPGRLAV